MRTKGEGEGRTTSEHGRRGRGEERGTNDKKDEEGNAREQNKTNGETNRSGHLLFLLFLLLLLPLLLLLLLFLFLLLLLPPLRPFVVRARSGALRGGASTTTTAEAEAAAAEEEEEEEEEEARIRFSHFSAPGGPFRALGPSKIGPG